MTSIGEGQPAQGSVAVGQQSAEARATRTAGVGMIYSTRNMTTARAAHTTTLLPNGLILVVGGFSGQNDQYFASAELYDPASQRFAAAAGMHERRASHTATLLRDGRVLIVGGFNGDYLDSVELYDPATGAFTPTGALHTARSDHVAALLADGKVLVAGGVGVGWTFLAGAEVYDPVTERWTPTGSMATARESHTMTALQDGRLLVAGGHEGRRAGITIHQSAELYDPSSGTFSATGAMAVKRHKHDAVLLADGRILISGGSDERDDAGVYTSAEVFDPATGAFTPTGAMPVGRYKHRGTSLLLPDGKALIAGGAQEAALYDPLDGTFQPVTGRLGQAPLSRLFAAATLLPDGTALITGGYGIGETTSAAAWLYRP